MIRKELENCILDLHPLTGGDADTRQILMTGAEKTFHYHKRSGTDPESVLFVAFRAGADKAAI